VLIHQNKKEILWTEEKKTQERLVCLMQSIAFIGMARVVALQTQRAVIGGRVRA